MKTQFLASCLALFAALAIAHAADDLSAVLQRGLFEEEANNNLAAAIKAYEAVVTATDAQRKLAGTALFRLAECYRKLGRTNDAVIHYQRVAHEYPDQTRLVDLSRQNLVGLGATAATDATAAGSKTARTEQRLLLEEEIKIVEADLKRLEAMVKSGVAGQDALSTKQRELLALRRQLAALADTPSDAAAVATPTDEEEKEVRRIQALLKDSPDLVNARNQVVFNPALQPPVSAEGHTLLHKAIIEGKARLAEFLLANGADPNAASGSNPSQPGLTPLALAARAGHKRLVELLLANGASVHGNAAFSPVHEAASQGYKSIVEVLLDAKADVNAVSGPKRTPLHEAAARGFPGVALALIARGADVNALHQNWTGGTQLRNTGRNFQFDGSALHFAAERGDRGMVELLLTNKADPNLRNHSGLPPLHVAVHRGFVPVADALLKGGADINAHAHDAANMGNNRRRWTALHFAAQTERLDMVQFLLDRGADPDRRHDLFNGEGGFTTLHLLLSYRPKDFLSMTDLLLQRKANPNLTNDNGVAPIFSVLRDGDKAPLELLLKHGAGPNVRDRDGSTPLNQQNLTRDICETLLAHKADPNLQNKWGYAPLHYLADAARRINAPPRADSPSGGYAPDPNSPAALAELLLTHGANPNLRNTSGFTPLNTFGTPANPTTPGMTAFVNVLLKHGAVDELLEPVSDPHALRVWRKGRPAPRVVFARDLDDRNCFTLLETIFAFYGFNKTPPIRVEAPLQMIDPATGLPAPAGRVSGGVDPATGLPLPGRPRPPRVTWGGDFKPAEDLPFPDFSRVRVHRLTDPQGTEKRVIEVNLLNARGEFDCAKDQWLEFGDLVELPEREFRLNEEKVGLTTDQSKVLLGCLTTQFKIIARDHTEEIALKGHLFMRQLANVMKMANVRAALRSSSDLTQLKLRRVDPMTKKPVTFTLNATEPALVRTYPEDDLVLRDGDVIEVPEREGK